MSERWAVISVGTNSTRFLVADGSRIATQRSIGTRVGEGLRERGRIGEVPMERTLAAVRDHYRAIHGSCDRLFVIATSALRRAQNADEFADRVRAIAGVDLRILTGEEEAIASYRGAVTALRGSDGPRAGVLDAGGGSTEYAIGDRSHAADLLSCEIGAVRLTEWCPGLSGAHGRVDAATIERARALAGERLAAVARFQHVDALVLVGGSATTTAALVRGRRTAFVRLDLARETLAEWFDRLCSLPLEKRKLLPGMNPQRADILPAGICIAEAALALTGHDRATVTTRDLPYGFLLIERERTPR